MKKRRLKNIIKGYENIAINLLAEKMKNAVYMNAVTHMKDWYWSHKNAFVNQNTSIEIVYRINMCVGDFLEAIGGYKRSQEETMKQQDPQL